MSASPDIAREIADLAVQRLAQALRLPDSAAPTLDAARAQVERAIKQRYGGDEVYVRRSLETPAERAAAVRRDHEAGLAIAKLQRIHGLSRATLYRYLREDD